MPPQGTTERDARRAARNQEKPARDRSKESDRVTITVDQDGKADVSKMKGPTLEKLRRALDGVDLSGAPKPPTTDAPAADATAAPGPGADPAEELWGDEQVREVLRVAGMLQTGIAMRVWGVDLKTARAIVEYDDAELDRLTPPATRVANKYSPAWAKKYRDEISLCLTFGSILQGKVSRLNDHVTKNTVAATPGAPRPRPAPAPAPPAPTSDGRPDTATAETTRAAEHVRSIAPRVDQVG